MSFSYPRREIVRRPIESYSTRSSVRLVAADSQNAPTQAVFEAVKPCQLIAIPSIDKLVSTSYPSYPTEKSLDDFRPEILCVM